MFLSLSPRYARSLPYSRILLCILRVATASVRLQCSYTDFANLMAIGASPHSRILGLFFSSQFFKRICNSSRLIFYNTEQMWTISIRRDSAACIAYRYASSPMTDYDRLLRYRLCKRIRTSIY